MSPLDMIIEDGLLIRGTWDGTDAHGRATACLLSVMSPEAAKARDARACPAAVMPEFMACLTLFIDNDGTLAHWPAVVRKYASLAYRWHVLTLEQWKRLDCECRAIAVREARTHANSASALALFDHVLALLDRAIRGEVVSNQEWKTAENAAIDAWDDAAAEAVEAGGAVAAARAAMTDAGWVGLVRTTLGVNPMALKAMAVRDGLRQQAADRMIDAMLAAIETEIAKTENLATVTPSRGGE